MDDDTFDYVVVGAGSAGAVIASRLSEDPTLKVCLVEAGPVDRSPLIHVPLGIAALLKHEKLNWRYPTAPQRELAGRSLEFPAGRVLGGSSSINGMVYHRGHPLDYDDWAKSGNVGWSFREILPYFVRSENNHGWRSSAYHGIDGPLHVSNMSQVNRISHDFIDAGAALQYRRCDDLAGPDPEGFGIRQVTQRRGRRSSTATSFLAAARGRRNLRIFTDTLTHRVVFEGRCAKAVEVSHKGAVRTIRARREIILSAGAIGSPAILLRSGIGDGAHLRDLDIAVIHDLPEVGRNLQDHIASFLQYQTKDTTPYGISLKVLPRLAWGGVEYLLFRRGLLSSNGMEAAAFIKSMPGLDRPDLQMTFIAGRLARNGRLGVGSGHGYGLSVILLRPKSRGRVTLGSREALKPVIDPLFFREEEDLELLLRGLKIGREVLAAPPFHRYKGRECQPGPDVQSNADLRNYIAETAATVFHPAGTCRMGADEGSVTDPQLRVRGLESLRVADASVMPTVIGGNTNAPSIMIGEKASDMILGRPAPRPADI